MIQGTTPAYTLTIQGYDLTDKTVYVTVKNGKKRITKTGSALTVVCTEDSSGNPVSTIAFRLSQEETLSLEAGSAQVQVRFIDSNGVALATAKGKLQVEDVLLPTVIQYGGD